MPIQNSNYQEINFQSVTKPQVVVKVQTDTYANIYSFFQQINQPF